MIDYEAIERGIIRSEKIIDMATAFVKAREDYEFALRSGSLDFTKKHQVSKLYEQLRDVINSPLPNPEV